MGRHKSLSDNQERCLVSDYGFGFQVKEIAKTFEVSQATVYNVLHSHGIKPNRRAVAKHKNEEAGTVIEAMTKPATKPSIWNRIRGFFGGEK